jgi:hypothetical protein
MHHLVLRINPGIMVEVTARGKGKEAARDT